ncbi:MAG: hypothetical protein LBC86_08785 [Oscillospiraceae bacterium]|nr:hypothetical protein [Oscillospiraceae bacterium]
MIATANRKSKAVIVAAIATTVPTNAMSICSAVFLPAVASGSTINQ